MKKNAIKKDLKNYFRFSDGPEWNPWGAEHNSSGNYALTVPKYVYSALVLLLMLFLSFQAVFGTSERQVLKKGMNSDQVAQVQKDLKQLGFFTENVTGYYGQVTEATVIKFQKEYGLNPDGIVGDSTYSKLDSLINAFRSDSVLEKGVSSSDVTALQRDLKQLGFFSLNPTGYYGEATEAAVIKFQKEYGLVPDGKAGENTYRKIDILLKRADSIKIVIDPGHGGVDKGASKGKVVESEVNLSISKKLKTYLSEYGYDVVLTRSSDVALDRLSNRGETRQERDLNARTNIINKSGAALFVSIHVDSYPEYPSTSGSVVYYNGKCPGSKELAKNIQKALNNLTVSNMKRQSHNSQEGNFYILRNSNVPGVLVETAFITNSRERELLATDSFRDKLARAILTGIRNTKLDF